MWNFLVLGIVPGTQIQINFKLWLLIFTASALLFVCLRALVHKLRQTHKFHPSISSEAH